MLEQDLELIKRCKNGEQSAFAELYQEYIQFAYGTALLLVKNTSVASDVCQDAFLKVFLNIQRFREGSPFKPWFYRIIVNEAMRLTRRIMRWQMPIEKIPADLPTPLNSPEAILVNKEQAVQIWQSVDKLSNKLKIPIVLRYYADLTEEEIAYTLKIPLGTAKSRLNRGREQLRLILPGNFLVTGGVYNA